MKYIIVLVMIVGCTTVHLAPDAVRTKTYVIETTYSKEKAYDSVLSWVSNNGGLVRLNDRTGGIIGLRANVKCKALKLGSGFADDERLWYLLELKAEDNRVTVTFSDIKAEAYGVWDSGARPTNQAETEKAAAECLEPQLITLRAKLSI